VGSVDGGFSHYRLRGVDAPCREFRCGGLGRPYTHMAHRIHQNLREHWTAFCRASLLFCLDVACIFTAEAIFYSIVFMAGDWNYQDDVSLQ